MHPLLTPSTHADLELCARELTMAGYYDGDSGACYLKMLMGTTLGLTIFESIHGVSFQDGKTVVEKILIERVLHRNEVKVITVSNDPAVGCQLEFTRSGRKLGMSLVLLKDVPSPDVLYDVALARGVRTHMTDLFPHKFYLKSELSVQSAEHPLLPKLQDDMAKKSRVPVITADKLTVPKHPNKLALAQDSQTLLDWKNKLLTLSAEKPEEWDNHLTVLSDFAFLTEAQKDDVFASMVETSRSYGVDYDAKTGRFFLAEVPQLSE